MISNWNDRSIQDDPRNREPDEPSQIECWVCEQWVDEIETFEHDNITFCSLECLSEYNSQE